MRKRISRLNEELVNQIAAGEVVERPASIIKELVENSLDAESTKIDVFLKEGGIQEIGVIDNGFGIMAEEFPLAFERHATSKIQSLDDLQHLGSYGFRGEALAAIQSVADIELKSRTPDGQEAALLEIRAGVSLPLRPLGAPVGTSLFVRNLFSRVPARLKFLRSPSTELSYCTKLFKELALGAPEVDFSLSHQGKTFLKFRANSPRKRFQEIYKPAWKPIEIEEENEGLAYHALLSPPSLFQEKGELFFYVNQRMIRSKLFSSAVRNAYTELLGYQHDPSGVVYLQILPEWVDVNVHPQKLEVRCLKQDRIYQWLYSSIKKNLALLHKPPSSPLTASEPVSPFPPLETPPPLLVIKDRFLLRENETGLEMINLPELNRKIWKNRFLQERRILGITLAVPRLLHFSGSHVNALLLHKKELSLLGFEFEEYGNGDIALLAAPDYLEDSHLEPVFRHIAARPTTEGLVEILSQHAKQLPLEQLFDELKKMKEGFTPETEKPILWRMPYEWIERHFE